MTNMQIISSMFLILLFSSKVICQETIPSDSTTVKSKEILTQENIIVVFEETEYSKHKKISNDPIKLGEYFFIVPDPTDYSGHNSNLPLTLVDKKYKDFDAKFSDNPLPRLKIHKSFLRKNKDRILSIKKMRQNGYEEIFQLFKGANHIFLIDKSETKGNTITLKEVSFFQIGKE